MDKDKGLTEAQLNEAVEVLKDAPQGCLCIRRFQLVSENYIFQEIANYCPKCGRKFDKS